MLYNLSPGPTRPQNCEIIKIQYNSIQLKPKYFQKEEEDIIDNQFPLAAWILMFITIFSTNKWHLPPKLLEDRSSENLPLSLSVSKLEIRFQLSFTMYCIQGWAQVGAWAPPVQIFIYLFIVIIYFIFVVGPSIQNLSSHFPQLA